MQLKLDKMLKYIITNNLKKILSERKTYFYIEINVSKE